MNDTIAKSSKGHQRFLTKRIVLPKVHDMLPNEQHKHRKMYLKQSLFTKMPVLNNSEMFLKGSCLKDFNFLK